MTILYIILGIVALVYIAITGFALMVNVFTAPGQSGMWGAIFHRCNAREKIMLSPGLLWVLPLMVAAWAIRSVSRLRK